jgi:hypothetical protein
MVFVFLIIFLLFLCSVGYVTYRIYSLNDQIKKANLEVVNLSSEIRANDEAVNKYVLTKGILDYLYVIDKSKFQYKKYMDEIVAILPENVILRGVDFATKGWVSAVVVLPDLVTLRSFESRISDKSIIDQTVFGSVFSEGISKDKQNGYVIKLEFELKKNE